MLKLSHEIHSPTRSKSVLGCSADSSMGRTVGSQITMVHLFNLSVALQLSRARNTSLGLTPHSQVAPIPLEVAEIFM
jgi:hypothetical protein